MWSKVLSKNICIPKKSLVVLGFSARILGAFLSRKLRVGPSFSNLCITRKRPNFNHFVEVGVYASLVVIYIFEKKA